MTTWLVSALGVAALIPLLFSVSWSARWAIRTLTRRAVRRAQRSRGCWRVRLDRLGDDGHADARKRQRADAAARMLGHFVTGVVFINGVFIAMHLVGVDPVVAVSSAGFIGVALALSGQDLIKDMISGTMALLEDRYAAGDNVIFLVSGVQVAGTVDLIGAASVRLRSGDGATWHVGHHKIESVTNLSQLPSINEIEMPAEGWHHTDDAAVADLLTAASNDVGLTGVVFLRDIETFEPTQEPLDTSTFDTSTSATSAPQTITLRVKTNRPLSPSEEQVVRARLLG